MNKDFKIPQKYLIDFDTLKVGDRVWSIKQGYVEIVEITKESVMAGDWWFSDKGQFASYDKYPSIFRVNPFEDIREEFFADRLMEVRSSNDKKWIKRVVFGFKNGKYLSWEFVNTLDNVSCVTDVTTWLQAREITPPSEELVHLTLQDISEGRGKGVPAHLIRIKE